MTERRASSTAARWGAIKAKAPDLNWKVRKVSFATLVYGPGGGKLVIDEFALTALHRDSVAVGEKMTVYYRPARPNIAVGGPSWNWLRGFLELTGLGLLILFGAWLARKAAFWFLTEEEKLAVEAVKKARSADSFGSRLGKAAVATPLAFFGTFGLYGGGAMMLAAGVGYGCDHLWRERQRVDHGDGDGGSARSANSPTRRAPFPRSPKRSTAPMRRRKRAMLPQVRWKTRKRTEVRFAYTASDGRTRNAKKTTSRDIATFPGVGGQIKVQYPESRPASVTIAPDAGLMRSLLWFLAISAASSSSASSAADPEAVRKA